MRIKKILVLVLYALTTFFFSGCGDRILLYPGPRLPLKRVAYLTTSELTTLKIDGKTVLPDPNKENVISVELLPGTYEIEWTCKKTYATFTYSGRGTLNAKANKMYMFAFSYLPGRTTRNYSIGEITIKVEDYATWIIETHPFHFPPKVVVGVRPPWAR